MKKVIIILAIIVAILSINKNDQIIIPKDSIRFRIIASSDTAEDQTIKKEILNNLSTELINTQKTNNIEQTREYIKQNLPTYQEIVEKTLEENGIDKEFEINYGKNYFPKKEYKNVIYEEGEYESLVITLGEGKGKNFWCVLFPPLCLVDETQENVEYKSLVKEIIDKYF